MLKLTPYFNMEIDETTIKGIIEKVNDIEQIQVKQWKLIDHLEKMINEINGNKICNI